MLSVGSELDSRVPNRAALTGTCIRRVCAGQSCCNKTDKMRKYMGMFRELTNGTYVHSLMLGFDEDDVRLFPALLRALLVTSSSTDL